MTDMWISLPGVSSDNPAYPGGWHFVGNPFNHNVLWTDIKVTDGTETIDMITACELGWLDGYWEYLNGASQGISLVDFEGILGSEYLQPGHMYKVFTRKANLALIIPAN